MDSDYLELQNLRSEMKADGTQGKKNKSAVLGFSVPTFPTSSEKPNFSH